MSSTMFNKPLDTEFVGTVNGLSERIDDINDKIGTVPSGQTVEGQIGNKVNTSAIANNLTTTASGYVLDARQGKALNDKVAGIPQYIVRTKYYEALGIAAHAEGLISIAPDAVSGYTRIFSVAEPIGLYQIHSFSSSQNYVSYRNIATSAQTMSGNLISLYRKN